MNEHIWHDFMERLVADEIKLKAFCNLDADDIDAWLATHQMGVTLTQLLESSPRMTKAEDKGHIGRYAERRLQQEVERNALYLSPDSPLSD